MRAVVVGQRERLRRLAEGELGGDPLAMVEVVAAQLHRGLR